VDLLKKVPAILIGVRVCLGPLLFIFAKNGYSSAWILGTLLVAMLSDIFDGVIARRLGIVTAKLRVADSRADAWFFICVGAAVWASAADIVRTFWIPLTIEVVIQIASYTFDLMRYGRIASLHAYTAKAWGFTLYLAAGALLAFHTGVLIWVAFAFGIASAVDALAIKLILPGWQHDVLSAFHAWHRRPGARTLTSP
jgi:CDP-diacylglycerol--glycerol-3-phosphate 3-phosphatidyltransferase